MESNPVKMYAAEFIGTLSLVLIGCGSAVFGGDLVGISIAFGMTVTAMAYAIGPISGCHINPAISIAMTVAGKLPGKHLAGYIGAQVLGGLAGAALLFLIASGVEGWDAAHSMGQNGFEEWSPAVGGKFGTMAAFIAEVVFTFLFLIVIFGSTSEKASPGFAGLAIGMSLVIIHLVSIPITGTSVNPARSIGPAVFAGTEHITQLWLFVVGPVVGGVLAAVTWKGLFESK